jgi:hypothetical protein
MRAGRCACSSACIKPSPEKENAVLLLNEGLTRMNPDPDKLTGQCQVEVFIGGLQNEVPHR